MYSVFTALVRQSGHVRPCLHVIQCCQTLRMQVTSAVDLSLHELKPLFVTGPYVAV